MTLADEKETGVGIMHAAKSIFVSEFLL